MNHIRQEYALRMGLIEDKFHIICQRYHELTKQLARKDQHISQLNSHIQALSSKLSQANSTILHLQTKLNQSQIATKIPLVPPKSKHEPNESIRSQWRTQHKSKLIQPRQLHSPTKEQSQQSISEQLEIKPIVNEQQNFEDVLNRLKAKIGRPIAAGESTYKQTNNSATTLLTQPHSRGLLSRVKSVENILNEPVVSAENIKTLQSIWQERDSEISKMDQLFQNINSKLKDYEQ